MLPEIRRMTTEQPQEYVPRLTKSLAGAGVALVICPHLSKTYAHGAVFPLGNEKTVMMLTIRGRWADVFWFSLFHELGHILLHRRQGVIVEYDNGVSDIKDMETEADKFAANTLIPPQEWDTFIMENNTFFPITIQTFASRIGVHTGIIVGRLQHEKLLKQDWLKKLRTRYIWMEQFVVRS